MMVIPTTNPPIYQYKKEPLKIVSIINGNKGIADKNSIRVPNRDTKFGILVALSYSRFLLMSFSCAFNISELTILYFTTLKCNISLGSYKVTTLSYYTSQHCGVQAHEVSL
jgi:hypothetical protein